MLVTAKTFPKVANELHEKLTNKEVTRNDSKIVKVSCSSLRFINDYWYRPGGTTLEVESMIGPWEDYVQCYGK